MSDLAPPGAIHLKLPATSANLGPGFDALGLAMSFYLTIEARVSADGNFSIAATGRDRELCGTLNKNLILETYSDVIARAGKAVLPLNLLLHNEIPLGMGCGSSAAAILAGVLLANHFGGLSWTGYQAMEEACRREGHPDNVAACWLGGMTASAMKIAEARTIVTAASCARECKWGLMLVVPSVSLETEKARAMLPKTYSREDAVANIQNTALLVAAFALGQPGLLKTATADRIHQPYRMQACPLLPLLLPMLDQEGVYGVALSGAGPSVLLIVDPACSKAIQSSVLERAPDVQLINAVTSKETEIRLLQ